MKSNYTDLAIDALIAKSMSTHLVEIDESQAAELVAELENIELDTSAVLEKLPSTFSEIEVGQSKRRKSLCESLTLSSFMAMNRDNEDDSFDSDTEDELNTARKIARSKLIKEQDRKENTDD